MILVKLELHSAITGKVTSLGMMIANDGTGSRESGNYVAGLVSKGGRRGRQATIAGHRRLSSSIWVLVAKALQALYHQAPELDAEAKDEVEFIPGRVS